MNQLRKLFVKIFGWTRKMPTDLDRDGIKPFLVFYTDGSIAYKEGEALKIPVFALSQYESNLINLFRDVHLRQGMVKKEMEYRAIVKRDADALTEMSKPKPDIKIVPGGGIPNQKVKPK